MKAQPYLPSQQRAIIYMFILFSTFSLFQTALNASFQDLPESHQSLPSFPIPAAIDLNIVSTQELQEVEGIGFVLAKRILAYRKKLGGFRTIAELDKVYGLNGEGLENLRIMSCVDSLDVRPKPLRSSPKVRRNRKQIAKINLNRATAKELERIPGIGKKISSRIIKYRRAKGNFLAVEELREVNNFSEENYYRAKPFLMVNKSDQNEIKLLDLNKATAFQIKKHLQIDSKLVGNIIELRNKIGFYSNLDQLKKVKSMKADLYNDLIQKFTIGTSLPEPIYVLEQVSTWDLAAYPNISENLAMNLVMKVKINGKFGSWDEVNGVEGMNKKALAELKTYFKLAIHQ